MLWKLLSVGGVCWWLWRLWRLWSARRVLQCARQIHCRLLSLPLIGHAYIFLGSNQDRMTALKNVLYDAMNHENNLTKLWIGLDFYVVAVDPRDIECISRRCLDKPRVTRFARSLIGNGSLFAPAHIWRPRRKVMAATFSQKFLNDFVKTFSSQSLVLVERLAAVAGGDTFSFWPFVIAYTMDSICETTLGVELNAQSQPKQPFLMAFAEYCRLGSQRLFKPWLYPNAIYRLHPDRPVLKKHALTIKQFIHDVIEKKQNDVIKKNAGDEPGEGARCIVEAVVAGRRLGPAALGEEALVLTLAGTDTSAVGTAFAALLLAEHPRVQQAVYDEVKAVMGPNIRPIESSDLPKLKYLEAVIKESLRLYPPVPITVRAIDEDITLPSGVRLVKGSNAIFGLWGAHHSKKYWGQDVEEFKPERFLAGGDNPAFMPFGNAPKSCLGYQYAMMSMKTMLATLVARCRLAPAAGRAPGPLPVVYNMMMKHADDFQLRLNYR